MRTPAFRRSRFIPAFAAAALSLLLVLSARADEYLDRINRLYTLQIRDGKRAIPLPQSQRSDLVLLPAIAKMDPVPDAIGKDLEKSVQLTEASASWASLQAWAAAAPQKAVLDAIMAVTKSDAPDARMVFAQPYGVDGVESELVAADLYTELGDPPLLAAADYKYLKVGIVKALCLVHVEANRLFAEKKGDDAIELLMHWAAFGRQIADREMAPEKASGMAIAALSLEHIADIAYRDYRSPTRCITLEKLRNINERLDERKAAFGGERMLFPAGMRLAGEQLVNRVYAGGIGDRANPDIYGPTLAQITTGERPLRLFSEAAAWDRLRMISGKKPDVLATVQKVVGDFEYRWNLGPFDPQLTTESDFQKLVSGKRSNAVVAVVTAQAQDLFRMRQVVRTEVKGIRMALAMYAFSLKNNNLPAAITAIRPSFTPTMEPDPFSRQGRNFEFFVPSRDLPAKPRLYDVTIVGRGKGDKKRPNFVSRIDEKDFIIYSVGPDDDRGWATVCISGLGDDAKEGDILIWPPEISLERKHLMQEGKLR